MPMIGCWTMLVGSSCANRMHIREFGSNLRLGRGEKRKTGPFYFFAKQSSLRSSNRSQIGREMLKVFAFFCRFCLLVCTKLESIWTYFVLWFKAILFIPALADDCVGNSGIYIIPASQMVAIFWELGIGLLNKCQLAEIHFLSWSHYLSLNLKSNTLTVVNCMYKC